MGTDACHCVEGVGRGLLDGLVLDGRVVGGIVDLHGAIQEEKMLAHPVVAACVLFVVVVAQAEAPALLLFRLGEALDRASIDGDRRWGGLGRC